MGGVVENDDVGDGDERVEGEFTGDAVELDVGGKAGKQAGGNGAEETGQDNKESKLQAIDNA